VFERFLSDPSFGNLVLVFAIWIIVSAVWEVDGAWEEDGLAGAKRALKKIAAWTLGCTLLCVWFFLSLFLGGKDLKTGLSIFFAGLVTVAGLWIYMRARG